MHLVLCESLWGHFAAVIDSVTQWGLNWLEVLYELAKHQAKYVLLHYDTWTLYLKQPSAMATVLLASYTWH